MTVDMCTSPLADINIHEYVCEKYIIYKCENKSVKIIII